MVKFICPYSKTIISEKNQIGSYIRYNTKKYNISSDDLRYLIFKESFGEIAEKDKFQFYYEIEQYSLPCFLKTFGMNYGTTSFLISYHGLRRRGFKESAVMGAKRGKMTNLERYGVDQTFKVKEFDDKRKKTYRDKYGVENPFEKRACLQNIDDLYIKKYGISHREFASIKSKQAWGSKTEDEKNEWLDCSIRNDKSKTECLSTIGKNQASKMEIRIGKILLEEGFDIISQFKLKRYAFDFLIKSLNILVEFNGDLFHANPNKYLKDDIIPIVKKTAGEIWEKDKKKFDLAIENGYNILVIWETEIKNKSDQEITTLFYDKLSNI